MRKNNNLLLAFIISGAISVLIMILIIFMYTMYNIHPDSDIKLPGIKLSFLNTKYSMVSTVEYKNIQQQIEEGYVTGPNMNEMCTICLNTYSGDKQMATLKCAHWFHKECLEAHLKSSKICPTCKQ